MMRKCNYIYILIVSIMFCGCTKETTIDSYTLNDAIHFSVGRATKIESRALLDYDIDNLTSFKLSGISDSRTLFDDVSVAKEGNNWVYDGEMQYCTSDEKVSYFAYVSDKEILPTLLSNTLSFDYAITEGDAEDDLLISAFTEVNNPNVEINFAHALAAISFEVVGVSNCKVVGLSLSQIYDSANISLSEGNQIEWSNHSLTPKQDFEVTLADDTTPNEDGVTPQTIINDDGYLMMIPQKLPANAVATIIIEKLNGDSTMQATKYIPLNKYSEWEAGCHYKYTLNIDDKFGILDNMTISSVEELEYFRSLVEMGWAPKRATLTADIDLGGETWNPIPLYSGYFDGGGFTIRNLSNDDGLFSTITGSVVNLTLENPHIEGAHAIGALCGSLRGGYIYNCGVDGGSVVVSSMKAGGLVGAASSNATITYCHSSADIYGIGGAKGGIVGSCEDSYIEACYNTGPIHGSNTSRGGIAGSAYRSIIKACYNAGDIESTAWCGGIAGALHDASITACYSVSPQSCPYGFTGYIAGDIYNNSSVTSCYYLLIRDKTTGNDYGTQVRSIGELNDVVSDMNNAAHLNVEASSYFKVNSDNILPSLSGEEIVCDQVQLESMEINSIADFERFRDLVNSGVSPKNAILTVDLDLCYDLWTQIGNSECYCSTNFDGGGHTISNLRCYDGGLFGYMKGGSISNLFLEYADFSSNDYYFGAICDYVDSDSSVTNCGVKNGTMYGYSDYTGGIVGYSKSPITNCYNLATIEGCDYTGGIVGFTSDSVVSCYNSGDILGQNNVGGIAGWIENSYYDETDEQNMINACYNTASVNGSGEYIGGIAGYVEATVYNCYNTGLIKGISTEYVSGINHSCNFCYYLGTSDFFNDENDCDSVTDDTMRSDSFVGWLNGNGAYWEINYNYNFNNGYPTLINIDYSQF